ncbi:Uu.00g096260.m01.CDS01 [Anthostomella pinea]|uniref:Uu.00g096260.m01.CDS01 n=1 Tax=Anthostomella pinea TaxID=933095 RepID=A0AAI8YEY0_9PEZI|nr:Uu.00g096260.m01.CDS01 [Anthostomella pinea]
MPLRCAVSPLASAHQNPRQWLLLYSFTAAPPSPAMAAATARRPFHSTTSLRDNAIDNSRNHYETLKLQPGATPAEVKKSFYTLSKNHHPDLHPSDTHAAQRFMRISEAYSILSVPAKRAAYDRDTLRLHTSSHGSTHGRTRPGGSYSSTNPAGGRPASGLSRRRGTFTGPPPSFFRSGGWGGQAGKRRAAHEESTGGGTGTGSSSDPGSGSSHTGAGSTGGMGPGQDPFGHQGDVPHFDREGHERTGRRHERRREARRSQVDGQEISFEPERGVAGMFFMIGGVIMVSFLGPFAISRLWGGGGSRKEKDKKGNG